MSLEESEEKGKSRKYITNQETLYEKDIEEIKQHCHEPIIISDTNCIGKTEWKQYSVVVRKESEDYLVPNHPPGEMPLFSFSCSTRSF